jgi:hypothetical protein
MDYLDRANEIFAAIRGIAATIPGYRAPVSANEMRALVRLANLPPEFIEELAVAVEASPDLQRMDRLRPEDARDARDFDRFCAIVADELEIIARGIRYAGRSRLASVGGLALQTFAVAKSLNRVEPIIPHLQALQQLLDAKKRKRRKRKDV